MNGFDLVADLNAQDDDGLGWSTLADALVAVTPPGGRMTGFRRCHTAADADGTLFLRYEVDHHGR